MLDSTTPIAVVGISNVVPLRLMALANQCRHNMTFIFVFEMMWALRKTLNMTLVNTFTAIARKRNNKAIMVSDCRSFGGVNDRLAIVTPAAAEDYFLNPYKLIKEDPYAKFGARGNEVDWKRVINPESLLRNVYEASDIKIIKSKYIRGVDRIVMKRKVTEMIDAFHFMDETQPFCPEIDED